MPQTVLVTGAAGYIASRLIPRLLKAGYNVRCMVRRPERLRGREWYSSVEIVAADVIQPDSLSLAMQGVNAAYYLIHSMAAGHGYDRVDLLSARNFSQAARQAGVEHIIYLGGLADPSDPGLARHLKSRIESGDALREAGVPVTEFRAGVIVGPGSVSFEMIRFSVEQLPILAVPGREHFSQPIAISNVLDFLIAALTTPSARGQVIEIGSPEVYTYKEIVSRYAQIRGLKRIPLPLPFFPVSLMVLFIELFTPVERSYAHPLIEGLQNDSVVLDQRSLSLFPDIHLLDYTSAVQRALAETHPDLMERIWLDLGKDAVEMKHEGMLVDYRRIHFPQTLHGHLDEAFAVLRRSVTAPSFHLGQIRDFEVDLLDPDAATLRLKVTAPNFPGDGWLEWKLTSNQLEQTVFFAPKGMSGFNSGYGLYVFYRRIIIRLIHSLMDEVLSRGRSS